MTETINLEVKLRAYFRHLSRGRWSAVCPQLGVASQGANSEEAKRSLEEAVELWFESCIERGVLDQALREANFRPRFQQLDPSEETADDNGEDILGQNFTIQVRIPAYQASVLMAESA
jgi:predicted RNase H-like HicB family nuclease